MTIPQKKGCGNAGCSSEFFGVKRIMEQAPHHHARHGGRNGIRAIPLLLLRKRHIFQGRIRTVSAARRILNGEPHPFDVGGFGYDKYFAYIAAFGAFTEVSYATPQSQKKLLGHLAYVLQGMAALPKLESYNTRVEYDDGVFEGRLVYGSMSNSTSVAGIVRLREEMVCLGDGESELVLVKDPGSVVGFGEIVDSVLSQRFDSDKLLILHTKKAKFTFEKPVAWTRDGEAGGEYSEIELRNYKAPVEMIF